ncbi:MAG: type VI secretion system-associated FHA domain protein TagH [Steroidobacteraceae bacterium]
MISEHRRPLGERGTMTFGMAGGTIGRSSDNDWVLPDPQRYVSAHHARIRFNRGQFELEDMSTNGLYVNDDERPLKDYGPYRLRHGDVLRLGEYELAVALEPELSRAGVAVAAGEPGYGYVGAEPEQNLAPESITVAALESMPTSINGLQSFGRAAQTDLGAALNLDELLVAESPSGRRLGPVNAYGQAVRPAHFPASPHAPATPHSSMTPHPPGSPHPPPGSRIPTLDPAAAGPGDPDAEAIARRMERLARAAARAQEARNASLPVPPEVHTGLQAFCRGAGLDIRLLPAEGQARLLQLVGQLVREALVGLKDLGRAREEIRNRLRIELPADPDDTRPSLVGSTVEDLLVAVLSQADSRKLDAVQWMREAIEAAKAHERATSQALRTAFVEFIDRFDPAELEARFERSARRNKSSGKDESRHWALFTDFYRNLTEMPPDQLPHTFVEAFASAYKKALATPRAPAPRGES